jgi:KDO2-lipid IV(A) lauroyltransferase
VPGAAGRTAYLAYRAGADVARALPPALGSTLARTTSRALTRVWATKRAQVEQNLQQVAGGRLTDAELRVATEAVFENYARYWHEMFRLSPRDLPTLEDRFESEGYEHLAAATSGGRGVVLALPHLGNWDLAGAWLAARGHRVTVVAETVEPPELFEWFVAQRRSLGMEVVALGPSSLVEVVRAAKSGAVICLVSDRDISGDGMPVELFGAATTMPGGPAMVALRAEVPLLSAGVYFLPHGRGIARIGPPLAVDRRGRLRDDVQRVTQELASRFEALIAAAPEQWLTMQPVWPASSRTGVPGVGTA